jgi:hypothetical protein
MPWRTEHSIEVEASRELAWRFWTNVENWAIDAAIASVEIEGPFSCGVQGTTKLADGSEIPWSIVELDEGERAVVLIRQPGAVARFTWRFESIEPERARLSQRVTVEGPVGNDEAEQMGDDLARNIEAGMEKLARAIERAAAEAR